MIHIYCFNYMQSMLYIYVDSSCTYVHNRPPAELPRIFERGVWLQGGGSYLALNSVPLNLGGGISFSLSFRSLSPSGTIFYLTDNNLMGYVTAHLSEGRVWLEYSQTGLDTIRVQTTYSYIDGEWYGLTVQLNQQGAVLTVNGTEIVQGGPSIVMPGAFNSTNYLFIGGLSPEVENVVETLRPSLSGCVRDVYVDDQLLDLQENIGSSRVSLGGCPEQVSHREMLTI